MEIKSCIVHNCSSKLTEKTIIYEFEFSLNFFHLDSMQDLWTYMPFGLDFTFVSITEL